MGFIKIKASVTNKRKYDTKIDKTLSKLRDRTKPHQMVRNYFVQQWMMNFVGQGSVYGKWPVLSPKSIKDRTWLENKGELAQHVGIYAPMLIRQNERLWRGFKTSVTAANVEPDITSWEFSNAPESGFMLSHHFGQNQPLGYGPLPARILWDINNPDAQYVTNVFGIWIAGRLNEF